MKPSEKYLMDWLLDAHAQEKQLERLLSATVAQLKDYPRIQERLQHHAIETRQQARLVQACIERRGGDTALVKEVAARCADMAPAPDLAGALRPDEQATAVLSVYAVKHAEIGAYRMLAAGAYALGDVQTQQICERILEQEVAMAEWLGGQLSRVAQAFLQQADRAVAATA